MQHHGAWMCSLCNGTRWLPAARSYGLPIQRQRLCFLSAGYSSESEAGLHWDDDDDDDDAGGGGGGGGGGVLEEEEMVVQPANTIVLRKAHPDDPVPFCIAGAPRFCMWPVWQNLSDPA